MADGEKQCPYCGESIRAEAIKCRYCGEFIEERRYPPGLEPSRSRFRQPREPDNATTIFVLGLLGLMVCGILGVFAFYMGKDYRELVAQGLVRRNGLADTGYILGIVSIAILALQVLAIVFAIAIPLALEK